MIIRKDLSSKEKCVSNVEVRAFYIASRGKKKALNSIVKDPFILLGEGIRIPTHRKLKD